MGGSCDGVRWGPSMNAKIRRSLHAIQNISANRSFSKGSKPSREGLGGSPIGVLRVQNTHTEKFSKVSQKLDGKFILGAIFHCFEKRFWLLYTNMAQIRKYQRIIFCGLGQRRNSSSLTYFYVLPNFLLLPP